MKRISLKSRYAHKNAIDLTPLIDLVFLLVVFFMVSSEIGKQGAIKIDLPVAKKTGAKVVTNNVISIDKNNRVYLNDQLIDPAKLKEEFLKHKEELAKEPIVLRGDKESSLEINVKVMDVLNQIGLSSFIISTETN